MDATLLEAASQIENPLLSEFKQKGGKVIGYPCSHVPEEVIEAAGMLPFRLRGIQTRSTSIGDTYFGPFVCSCPKALLQNAGRGRFHFLNGVIMVQACDSMRRLDECWRKAGNDFPGIVPDFFHYFGVPHKVTDYSIAWFADEIRKLAAALEKQFQVTITNEDLSRAIEETNETRRLLLRLEEIRRRPDTPVTGTEAMSLILAKTALPKKEYNKLLSKELKKLEKKSNPKNVGRLRVVLAGSVLDDVSLISLIEAEGALVVADTVCFGARAYRGEIPPGEDPYVTLARRYLNEQFCPRMFGYSKQRLALITDRFEAGNADGIIFQNIRFCDLHGSENGLFEGRLDKVGTPTMRIEREYGTMADEGRIRMRVAAFLETIKKRKNAA
ncbi:MAG: 2-hydroxyacyl-CoA dehydratase family protein [Thermodesulfobacteriota bacterium]